MQKIRLVKALVRYDGKYLLLKKAEDKFFLENIGKWESIGGVVEKKESSRIAIKREIKQETGLECKIVKQLPTITMKDKQYDSHCDVYLVNGISNNVKLSSEHSDYRWVNAEEVKNMPLVLYASLLLEFFNNPKKYLN